MRRAVILIIMAIPALLTYFSLNSEPSRALNTSHSVMVTVTAQPPIIIPDGGNGGDGSGWGGGSISPPPKLPPKPALTPGRLDVTDIVSEGGVFTKRVLLPSEDTKVVLEIEENTTALDKQGRPLSNIYVFAVGTSPPAPADKPSVGLIYEAGPPGSVFYPPIRLTLEYDEATLPPATAEEGLYIATRDGASAAWTRMDGSRVDIIRNTVSAPVNHFSEYTILADTTRQDTRGTHSEAVDDPRISFEFAEPPEAMPTPIPVEPSEPELPGAALPPTSALPGTASPPTPGGTEPLRQASLAVAIAGTLSIIILAIVKRRQCTSNKFTTPAKQDK